jgi:hypothetical protein
VNNFGKNAELQSKAVGDNLKQTQDLIAALSAIMANAKAKADRISDAEDVTPPSGGSPVGGIGTHNLRGPNA